MIHQDRDGCFLKLKSKIEKPSSYLNSAPKKHMAIIAIIFHFINSKEIQLLSLGMFKKFDSRCNRYVLLVQICSIMSSESFEFQKCSWYIAEIEIEKFWSWHVALWGTGQYVTNFLMQAIKEILILFLIFNKWWSLYRNSVLLQWLRYYKRIFLA